MAELDLGNLAFTWQGTYDDTIEYNKDDIVEYEGSSYVYIFPTSIIGVVPTNTTYWELLAQGLSYNKVYLDSDTGITRTFNNTSTESYIEGFQTQDRSFSAFSNVLLHIYVPFRSTSSAWGGLYTKVQFRINSGDWMDLGESGLTSPIAYGTNTFGAYTNCLLVSTKEQSDFTLGVRLAHKVHDGTATINTGLLAEGNNFFTHIIMEEKQ